MQQLEVLQCIVPLTNALQPVLSRNDYIFSSNYNCIVIIIANAFNCVSLGETPPCHLHVPVSHHQVIKLTHHSRLYVNNLLWTFRTYISIPHQGCIYSK